MKAAGFSLVLIVFILTSLLLFIYFTTPNVSDLIDRNPNTTSFIKIKCPEVSLQRWHQLNEISPFLSNAVILAEDPQFYYHRGLNWGNIYHALKANIRHGEFVWGGSSITMQLAKNLYMTPSKNIFRKIKEAIITFKLENKLSKKRILELYLNVAEWGPCIFGIGNASQYYFKNTPAEIGPHEAAFLASILPNPKLITKGKPPDSFMNSGANIFYELIQYYLPPIAALDSGSTSCDFMLNEIDARRIDYLIAKIFSNLAFDIKTGMASLTTRNDLMALLTPDEGEFIKNLLIRSNKILGEHDIECNRSFDKNIFVTFKQKDQLGNEKSFWLNSDATDALISLLVDASKEKVSLKINSAYRSDGYQIFLILSSIRKNGYCLSKALALVALPKNSEHVCTDRLAIDFGNASTGKAVSEDSKEYRWLEENASKYGFKQTYTKTNMSGIDFEPWHWCYHINQQLKQ
ncbi:MAG: hypothetical protein HN337_05420 [Deltaproteobacteria bacterium]|nr:hypothetical protein [Deltaproteobacteria bacterium]